MEEGFSTLGQYLSVLDRLMKMYYDHSLEGYAIGWGQQFYVEYLYEHPGATPQEMTQRFRVDKATLTKIIKKLTEVGYLQVTGDEQDRRVKHLYLTDDALPAARRVKEIHASFYEVLREGVSPEDLETTERTLRHMAENLGRNVRHRREVSQWETTTHSS